MVWLPKDRVDKEQFKWEVLEWKGWKEAETYWLGKEMLIHGSTKLSSEYFKKGAVVRDYPRRFSGVEYALVEVTTGTDRHGKTNVCLPFRVKDLKRFARKTLKELMENDV